MIKLYNDVNPADETRPPRMRQGKPAHKDQQPLTFARLYDATDETWWHLSWIRYNIGTPTKRHAPQPMPGGDIWYNCKLHVDGRAAHKANYWLSVNLVDGRISARWDNKTLSVYRLPLHRAISFLARTLAADAHKDLEATLYVVRPDGDSYLVEEEDSLTLAAHKARLAPRNALCAQLARLQVGQIHPTLEPVELIKEATRELAPMTFTGHPSLMGEGIDVKRTK